MSKILIAGALAGVFVAQVANAQTCTGYTYTLTNGTTADANQVMGNFNSILNCANNNLVPRNNPRFTGNVGIGTPNPVSTLQVHPAANQNLLIRSSWNPGVLSTGVSIDSTNDANSAWLPLQIGGAPVVFLSGNVGVGTANPVFPFYVNGTAGGTTNWTFNSDARLKTNVKPITDASNLIRRLRGVRYEWKPAEQREAGKSLNLSSGEPQIGFIAQEVEAVVPEAVSAPKPGGSDFYALKIDQLLPILVEAMKEQQSEIERLKGIVAELQSRR